MTASPVILLTPGDAAGIGPEIVARVLSSPEAYHLCRPVVVASASVMHDGIRIAGVSLKVRTLSNVNKARSTPGTVDLLDMANLDMQQLALGRVSAAAGKAAAEWIEAAASLLQQGAAQALVTAPINKEAVALAGYTDLGHQEMLQRLTGAPETANMLMSGGLRVVHLTTHRSLGDAVAYVKKDHLLAKLQLTHDSLRHWGFSAPRIGVAALNPHAGEGGLLGSEEAKEIAPAVIHAQKLGIVARGPFPADSIFYRAAQGEFDAVLALYHDQGHIAIKMYGFEESVSVTLGLPFIRTSVDHGTAYDIAGRGVAKSRSLLEALKVAARLVAKGTLVP